MNRVACPLTAACEEPNCDECWINLGRGLVADETVLRGAKKRMDQAYRQYCVTRYAADPFGRPLESYPYPHPPRGRPDRGYGDMGV